MSFFLFTIDEKLTNEWLKNNQMTTQINYELTLLLWFIGYLIYYKLNLKHYIKRYPRIRTNRIVNSYSLFSLLLTLLITLNPFNALAVYFMAKLIELKRWATG